MRHVVIGTAGHVDHGKTALVKALTGTDTDRFPEEKARGITIDIGFAALTLPDGTPASVVDVPGHEDFVRNMVAGATGIDVALLVVAADEGVMPQTIEHLAILGILGVRTGVVALTKSDLADADWLDLVRGDVAARLADSPVAWEPPVVVSSVTGQGLDQLREALQHGAARAAERSAGDLFRLPVDRVFSLAGAGTVVTGTSWSGSVAVGDQVTVLPGGGTARVRSVEVHGERRERAEPGRRTALALAGLDRAGAARGSVVVSHPSWRATTSVDAVVTLLASAPRSLHQRSRIRCHLGTAEVMARVTPAEGDIRPGATGLARLRFDDPVLARWGDRVVIRSYSPVTTIGGAVVVDPWPASRPRRPVPDARRAGLAVAARILGFVEASGSAGVAEADLPVRVGVPREGVAAAVAELTSGSSVARVHDVLVSTTALDAAGAAAVEALTRHHAAHPLAAGMPLELVRKAIGADGIAEHVLGSLATRGAIALDGGLVRLPDHTARLDSKQEVAGGALLAALDTGGFEGRTIAELQALGPAGQSRQVVEFLVRQGTAVRIGPDRYYHRDALQRLVTKTLSEMRKAGGGTPAQLRDILGLTRKYLIPFLEWMDGRGWTVRAGDSRVITPAGERHLSGTGSVRSNA